MHPYLIPSTCHTSTLILTPQCVTLSHTASRHLILHHTVCVTQHRPLALISPLSEVTVDELQWAPRTSQEGAFGAFELQVGVGITHWLCVTYKHRAVGRGLEACLAGFIWDGASIHVCVCMCRQILRGLQGLGAAGGWKAPHTTCHHTHWSSERVRCRVSC